MMKQSEVMNNTNIHIYMQTVANLVFTQMNAKKVIKLFGERVIATMINEFKQLHEG